MGQEFQGHTRAETPAGAPGVRAEREPRQPIHGFAALMGLVFLLAGVAGFIPGVTSRYGELELSGPESGAKLFGLFQVSVLHNIVHLLFALGLIAAARVAWARLYLLGGGVAYLAVALYGLVVGHGSDANLLPINDADTILHLGLGLAMIALGIAGSRLSRRAPQRSTLEGT